MNPRSWAWLGLSLLLASCRTAPPTAPLDLAAAGWAVREGQAVWIATRGATGVAGELLVATRTNGECFVQFSKPPFTLATIRVNPTDWSIELPQLRRHLHGRGAPPERFVWVQLGRVQAGEKCADDWRWSRTDAAGWLLANPRTGEKLEGFLPP